MSAHKKQHPGGAIRPFALLAALVLMLGVLATPVSAQATEEDEAVTSSGKSAPSEGDGIVSLVYANGKYTLTLKEAKAWEVKLIDPSPQEIVCGQNYGKPCTSTVYTFKSQADCVMVQVDWQSGSGYNSSDPTACKPTTPPEDDTDTKKVAFCHATGSESNPYVLIETSVNAFYQAGHDTHQHGRDIVPPFSYKKKGQAISFPGLNWDATGQAIFKNGCDTPVTPPKPEPVVEKKHEEGTPNCDLKTVTTTFYERTTDWTFDKSKNEWIKGEPSEWKVVKTETRDATEQECPKPDEPPIKIDLPKPAFEDPCGPNNAMWKDQVDTDVLTWKVDDQGNLVATIIKDKVTFKDGTTSHDFGIALDSGEECEEPTMPDFSVEAVCHYVLPINKEDETGQFFIYASEDDEGAGPYLIKPGQTAKVKTTATHIAWYVYYPDSYRDHKGSVDVPQDCETGAPQPEPPSGSPSKGTPFVPVNDVTPPTTTGVLPDTGAPSLLVLAWASLIGGAGVVLVRVASRRNKSIG